LNRQQVVTHGVVLAPARDHSPGEKSMLGHALGKRILLAATALALGCAALPASATFTSITVFGDSLSDGGNDYLLTGNTFPPPPYAQRFSNGPVAVEVLANQLGLPLLPSLAGGSNYAFGGAETGTGNFLAVRPDVPPIIQAIFSGNDTGILAQVQSFVPPPGFGPDSLVVLWGGPNDLFTAVTLGTPLAAIVLSAMTNIATEVSTLYAEGARTILVPNLADLGSTPFGLASGFAADLTAFSLGFDQALAQTIANLETGLPGLDIVPFDTFAAFAALQANPAAFGLTNVTAPCFDGVTVCATPDQYLFWDTAHPTAAGHRLLGAGFLAVVAPVPEPASLALVSLALLALGALRRRAR
jgi:phospholipase/lecithinase/hemolysin